MQLKTLIYYVLSFVQLLSYNLAELQTSKIPYKGQLRSIFQIPVMLVQIP